MNLAGSGQKVDFLYEEGSKSVPELSQFAHLGGQNREKAQRFVKEVCRCGSACQAVLAEP
jgi:hypothetical protein